jgi:hypothetical protein
VWLQLAVMAGVSLNRNSKAREREQSHPLSRRRQTSGKTTERLQRPGKFCPPHSQNKMKYVCQWI